MAVIAWRLTACSLSTSTGLFFFGLRIIRCYAQKVQTILALHTLDIQYFSVCLCSSRLLFDTRVSIPRTGDQQSALPLFGNMSIIKMENIKAIIHLLEYR